MIGCPIQNRDWILPEYLQSILDFDYSREDIHLAFYVNCSTDNTENILFKFKEKYVEQYNGIDIIVDNSLGYIDPLKPSERDYRMFAMIKNKFCKMRNDDDEFVLLIDSDTIAPSNLIKEFMGIARFGFPIIGCLVPQAQVNDIVLFNVMERQEDGTYKHLLNLVNEYSRYRCVDSIAGCVMYKKNVLDLAQFCYHPQGEDLSLCEVVVERGYDIICDTGIICEHYMKGRNDLSDEYSKYPYLK